MVRLVARRQRLAPVRVASIRLGAVPVAERQGPLVVPEPGAERQAVQVVQAGPSEPVASNPLGAELGAVPPLGAVPEPVASEVARQAEPGLPRPHRPYRGRYRVRLYILLRHYYRRVLRTYAQLA